MEIDGRFETNYSYDPGKRLSTIATEDLVAQAAVNSHTYAHDTLGRRSSQLFGDGTMEGSRKKTRLWRR